MHFKGTTCTSIFFIFAPGIYMFVTFFFLRRHKTLMPFVCIISHDAALLPSHETLQFRIIVAMQKLYDTSRNQEQVQNSTLSPSLSLPLKHLFLITWIMSHQKPANSASNMWVCAIDGDPCKSVLRSPPVTPSRSSNQQRAPVSLVKTHPLGPRDPGDQQSLSFPGRLWPVQTNDSATLVILIS